MKKYMLIAAAAIMISAVALVAKDSTATANCTDRTNCSNCTAVCK